METPKNLHKQVKLPMLRQSSEHRIPVMTKLETLKRENTSQNIINQSLKNIFKLKNTEQATIPPKTLLKSGATLSRPSLACKFEGKETLDCIKNTKLLRKANNLNQHSKQNINNDFKPNDFQRDKTFRVEPSIQSDKLDSNDDELRRSLSQFYQSNLSTGVTLKTIDLQQD